MREIIRSNRTAYGQKILNAGKQRRGYNPLCIFQCLHLPIERQICSKYSYHSPTLNKMKHHVKEEKKQMEVSRIIHAWRMHFTDRLLAAYHPNTNAKIWWFPAAL